MNQLNEFFDFSFPFFFTFVVVAACCVGKLGSSLAWGRQWESIQNKYNKIKQINA